ncbi:deleted in malignant brain tumors 1 protein-like [Huso huso]|uniref:Deleted in malignant brain tumors 1 protein-like n=1 Tax=Huso huso TaxID=61971 RepID=A0ABR0ZSJ5_HUSHU
METAVQLLVYALIAFGSAFPGSSAQETSNTAGVPSPKWYTTTRYPKISTWPYRTTAWPYRTTAWPYRTTAWPYRTTAWPYRTTAWPYRTTAWPYRTTAWPYRTTAWPYRTTAWPTTTSVPCGGQLTGERGEFTSPNYPYPYPNNARCVWYIKVDRHSQISLTLTNVRLECRYDYVRVYDGPSTSSPQIGDVCQADYETFHSSSNTMTVVFTSDHSVTGTGFTASYSYYDTASCAGLCGGSNALCSCDSSCVYSNSCCRDFCDVCPYVNYNYCSYTSTTSYPNPTTLEPATTTGPGSCRGNCYGSAGNCSCSSNCAYYNNCCDDFCNYCSYVNNGYCQPSSTPTPSTPGSCYGRCHGYAGNCSCSSNCAYYNNCCDDFCNYCSYVNYGYCYSTTFPTTPQVTATTMAPGSCRGNCYGSAGNCSCSSNCAYYNNCCDDFCNYCSYVNNGYCQPSSTPTPSTPGSCYGRCHGYAGNCSCSSNCAYYNNCCDDFCNYCSYVNYGYCYPTPFPTTPPVTGSCGGYLEGPYGSFSSPNYPYNYPNGAYCTWYIKVERNDKIYLTFLQIQMEACGNCNCDSISIYDGPSTNYRRIGFICRNNVTVFESSSNAMTVVFRTDGSVTATGFYAHYNTLHQNRANIQCSSDYMEVALQRSYIESLGYNASELYLNDPNCRPQTTGSQVLFRIPLNRCGTFREVNNGSIAYYNNIRAYSSGGVITRQTNLQLRVGCKMEQNTMVQIMYVAKEEVTANETSWGRYSVNMAFYTSDSFWRPVHEWPYYVDLNQDLFVQVQLNSSDSDLVVFVDTCMASPSSHDFVSKTYDLIRNGCVRDGTYSSYYSNSTNTARFKFSAFKFLRSHPSVYLQCKIAVCRAYDYSARCYRGCLPRSKRDLSSSESKTEVVVGPIQLRQEGSPGDQMKAGEKAPA